MVSAVQPPAYGGVSSAETDHRPATATAERAAGNAGTAAARATYAGAAGNALAAAGHRRARSRAAVESSGTDTGAADGLN